MAARHDRQTRLKPAARLLPRALLLVGAPALLSALLLWLPWPALDAFLSDPAGTPITDRTGALLAVMPGRGGSFEVRTRPTEMPSRCAEIFMKLEDGRFRSHPGVDPVAVLRAIGNRVLGRGAQSGASTITMQLARMVAPHSHGVFGKIVEAADAFRIESRLTKDRILGLYLDSVPFGRNARGIGAAAWTYFGADISTLGKAQFLALAVIPRNPRLFDPFDHPDRLAAAAREIVAQKGLGIDPVEIEQAVRGARSGRPATAAPHFARFVAGQLSRGELRVVGGSARTSLDLDLNDFIVTRVHSVLERYASARVTNAAVIVIENDTGAVRGWVGSRDFHDIGRSGQIDGVLIRRQSASTLKPFLYGSAIQKGWTAATLLPDVPIVFGAADDEVYRPENFDNRSHGVVRLRTALASSLNVPAVFTLSHVGLAGFLDTLGNLGFLLPKDAPSRYGLGTAIGNAEVSVLELARAFSVFPRGGTLPDLLVLDGQRPGSHRIFDTFSAWMICDILSDASARATGFGTRTFFRTPFPAMFKSGTSSEFTNLWCVGATPRYTVGVWAGNFDGRAVINKTGSIVPAQILTDVLIRLTGRNPAPGRSREFLPPANVVEARVCSVTGASATPRCPSTRKEYFRSAAEVPETCALHEHPEIRQTLLQQSFLAPGETVQILFPVTGQVFYRDETLRGGAQSVPVMVAVRQGHEARLFVDGAAVSQGTSFMGVALPMSRGAHSIVVKSSSGSDRVFYEVR